MLSYVFIFKNWPMTHLKGTTKPDLSSGTNVCMYVWYIYIINLEKRFYARFTNVLNCLYYFKLNFCF